MKTENKKRNIKVQVLADKTVFASGKANDRILEIVVTAPKKESTNERPPLNLSLVIDRSGSMQGEKLEYARRAAAHVVDLLSKKDSVAVVTYDDTINTLVSSQFMTELNKKTATDKIRSIHSGGSTNLGGGWLRGCEEVAGNSNENSFNRTLLLTDGLANVGMTSIEELSMHSRELFRRGVSTSCFGIGMGYDEHLLEAMANNGGGNFHFLETINAIPLVFEREFLELIDIAVKDIEITMKLPTSVKADISGGWQSEKTADGYLKVFIGSLISERSLSLFVKLHLKANVKEDEIIIPVMLTGKGNGETQFKTETVMILRRVSTEEESVVEADEALMERFVVVDLADKAKEALKRERRGDRAGAASLIHDSMKINQQYLSPSMSSKYASFSDDLSRGLDERSRKRIHQNEYESTRGRSSIRDYPVRVEKGYMIANIDDHAVLIDTGSEYSLGKQADWLFLNMVHPLKHESSGISVDQLGRTLDISIDIVMGMDIMKQFFVTIDLKNNRITFSQMPVRTTQSQIPLSLASGLPVCSAVVNGKNLDMVVDSSAKLTYIDKSLIEQLSPIDTEKDFFPRVGEFRSQVYELTVKLDNTNFKLRCGVVPPVGGSPFLTGLDHGILGIQLFRDHQVCLAFPQEQMGIMS